MCGALAEAADKATAAQAARLREIVHGIECHAIVFRGTIDLTQAELDRLVDTLLAAVPGVPRSAATGLASLYGGIARTTRERLPKPEALSADMHRSAGVMTTFLEQQRIGLFAVLASLENTLRRRLSEEASRLAATAAAAQALDLNATLARGFVLPLDRQRRIIRSAGTARAVDSFELLFVDGQVACRPTMS
jgi:exonuclease VII large subunit